MKVLQQTHDITNSSSSLEEEEEENNGGGCFGRILQNLFVQRCGRMPRKVPNEETRIIIPCGNVEEDFEATLRTYTRQNDSSRNNRHFVIAVKETGPAGLMRIENCDELLVMDDDDFLPFKTHEEVLDKFRNIKVDGKTRFSLVIRRRPKRKWVWIKTSAVLAPGSQSHYDNAPIIENAKYEKLDDTYNVITTTNRYKISGTQLYLDISDGRVTAAVITSSEQSDTKKICKHQRYWQDDDGQVHFEAALCDESGQHYIAVSPNKTVIVKNEPQWFEMREISSAILFKREDLYLGYNREEDQVDAQVTEFHFEEIPGDVELDISRNRCSSHDECSLAGFNPPPPKYFMSGVRQRLNSSRHSLSEFNSSIESLSSDSSDDENSLELSSERSHRFIFKKGVSYDSAHEKLCIKRQHIHECPSVGMDDSVSSGYLSIPIEQVDMANRDFSDTLILEQEKKGKQQCIYRETTV